jgi:serine/threonine protein kinase
VSLNSFQFVKRLGEGAYGTVVLATGSLLGAPEWLYAIKAMKKGLMTSSSMSDVYAERSALMQTAGHPFVTTLYACFQNKVFVNF